MTAFETTDSRIKLALVASAVPPRMDGIGDHTAGLAGSLAADVDVTVFTARGFAPDPIAGVQIVQCFDIAPRKAIADLEAAITREDFDWLVLQYNPFCFGRLGINPFLAGTLARIKRKKPTMKLAMMIHEKWMHTSTIKFAIMSIVQRRQFATISALADLTLFSTGPWADEYRKKYPARPTVHMPVGSNLPYIATDRLAVRSQLGFDENTVVLGSFGGDHPSRMFDRLAAAGRRLKSAGRDVRVLCIGSAGGSVKAAAPDLAVVDLGSLPADEVSKNLSAVDIYISPFFDGFSTRRGSFFAGIQHGLATVTTRNFHSDAEMLAHEGRAFLSPLSTDEPGFVSAVERLANDSELRAAMGRSAKKLFDENYSLPVLADKWKAQLQQQARVPVGVTS